MSAKTPKVAMLTSGGLAPCLSSAVGGLIERYSEVAPDIELLCYRNGYQGLLKGVSMPVDAAMREKAPLLHRYGGSPIGNSRVKVTNAKDCVKRGLVSEGQNPLEVAARQLVADGVTILHTIGGDDTSTQAAELAAYLKANGHDLTVVGLPKTVDNDIVPVKQSLGAWTAAEYGARFFDNVVNEQTANPNTLIIHEVMGRHCGWLTAATAAAYLHLSAHHEFPTGFLMNADLKAMDGVYVPELAFDIDAEAERLRARMARNGSVSIFVSEGAGVDAIVAERAAAGVELARDAFGHVKLDTINVGDWFAKQFSKAIGAEKTLVQKSGYYARSAAANVDDLRLIKGMADLAVQSALDAVPGLIGHDEDKGSRLRAIEFTRIKGGKAFDPTVSWFKDVMASTGQA
ncbi:MAG: pyrophosphate--fructose-6-phosphate 1-phosphotransferase [Rhizobiaceae bacterium]